jgi:putative tryptophan/tyrosine transport system substrate-binding protein
MPFDQLKRRQFITLLGGATAAWPIAARAQPGGVPVIGALHSASPSGIWLSLSAAFRQGLTEAGYSEDRNLVVDARWAEGQYDRLPAMAADLVKRDVALIAAFTTPSAYAAKAATAKIPIVFTTIADPVQIGFVSSLSRPGGNLTGVTQLSVEVGPKLLELLHVAVPSAKIMALLDNPANPNAAAQSKSLEAAAGRLGLQFHTINARTEADLDPAFAKVRELRVHALMISQDPVFNARPAEVAALSLRYAVPTIFAARDFVEAGGLMSYGAELRHTYRQAGIYAGRILKGEKPADLPVIQASKFEMVINLKTAKAIGLTLSPDVVSIADAVIE